MSSVEDDLRSRLACVLEATYWDRPYDTRLAAVRGLCDLTTNGLTPVDVAAVEHETEAAERQRLARESYARKRHHLVEGDTCYCVPPYADTRAPHRPGERAGCLAAAAALELAEQVAGGAP